MGSACRKSPFKPVTEARGGYFQDGYGLPFDLHLFFQPPVFRPEVFKAAESRILAQSFGTTHPFFQVIALKMESVKSRKGQSIAHPHRLKKSQKINK